MKNCCTCNEVMWICNKTLLLTLGELWYLEVPNKALLVVKKIKNEGYIEYHYYSKISQSKL